MRKFHSDFDGKTPTLECLFVHRRQGLLLEVYVDGHQNGGKKQNITTHVEDIDEERYPSKTRQCHL